MKHVVVCNCCFTLPFPNDIECEASFHTLIFHLCIFLMRCLLRSFACCLMELFVSFLLSFKSSQYHLDNGPVSDVSFVNVFSQSMPCLLIHLTFVFYEAEVCFCFLISMTSILSIISFTVCALDIASKKSSPSPSSSSFSPMLPYVFF